MPPGPNSISTTGTALTGLSSKPSDDTKSLKNFKADNQYLETTLQVLDDTNFEKSDICFLSVPKGFPIDLLPEIPTHIDQECEMQSDSVRYTIERNSSAKKKAIVPGKDSGYVCGKISNWITVRKSTEHVDCDRPKFIPRPDFPKISENLKERFHPFGSTKSVHSPQKRHKKSRKHKRKLGKRDASILDFDSVLGSPASKRMRRDIKTEPDDETKPKKWKKAKKVKKSKREKTVS